MTSTRREPHRPRKGEGVPEETIRAALDAGASVTQIAIDNRMDLRGLRRRLKKMRLTTKVPTAVYGRPPKILVLDIETAPIEAYVWRIFDENIGLDQIKHDTSIISFAAKWIGSNEIIYMDTGGRGVDKVRDDSILMPKLWELLNEADIVVAQNGQAFDVKRINARLLVHGYKPYSPIKMVDTKLQAKGKFAFTSNKQEWMTFILSGIRKSKHNKFPGFDLWLACLADKPLGWLELKRYNIIDVLGCEDLYLRFLAWDDKHPNVGTYELTAVKQCTKCGSVHVHPDGLTVLQAGVYVRFLCADCGGWSRGKQMQTATETRKGKLMPVGGN